MKKVLLILMALIALTYQGASAENPADYFNWYYGSYPGVAVGPNNTMPSFGNVNGYARDGVKIAIPGSADLQEVQGFDDDGQITTRDILLLDMSTKKVHIQGPIEGGAPYKVNIDKGIYACYSTSEWPTPFENGRQECKAFRFGLLSYEVSKLPGTYTVTFPAGALYINDEPCEEFTVTFNVEDNTVYTPYKFNFDVSPMADYPLNRLVYPQISINNWDASTNKDLYMTKGVNPVGDVTLTCVETNDVRICPFSNVGSSTSRLAWEADLGSIIETSGTYVLRIPEGKIRLQSLSSGANVTNYALEYTFIVDNKKYYEGNPKFSPAAGNVTSLQCIEIEQPNGYAVALPSPVLPFTLTMPDGTKKSVTPREGWRGHTIYVDLEAPVAAAGTCTLSIPESGLVYYKADADGDIADESNPMYSRAKTVSYNVTWGQEADLKYTTDPANGITIFKALENVFITFDEDVTPTYGLLATFKWPDGSTVHYPMDSAGNEDKTQLPYQYKVTWSEQNKRFMVGLHYPQEKGEYELTIPAGIAKTVDGKINKEFTVKVNWAEREVVDINIISDPENGTNVLTLPQEIYLTLPSEVRGSRLGDGGITSVLFYTPDATSSVNRYIKESGSKYFIDLRESYSGEIKANQGLYTVMIPEGSFILTMEDGSEAYNAAKTLSWRVTDVDAVEVIGADGFVTVYDLNGNLVLYKVSKDRLKELKGVYVVNGVKTVLR